MAFIEKDSLDHPVDRSGQAALSGVADGFVLAVLRSSPDCMKLLHRDGTLVFMNENGQRAMEIKDFSQLVGLAWSSLWPTEAQPLIEEAVETARAGRIASFTAFCPTAGGTPRWWEVRVAPLWDEEGAITHLLSSSRDVTERFEAEAALKDQIAEAKSELDTQRLLQSEVDHRVKNSFSQVSGLLRLQARGAAPEAQAALNTAAGRVSLMARVHERLYRDGDLSHIRLDRYLTDLSRDVFEAFGARRGTLDTHFAKVTVIKDQAVSIGLVASELVTNALKSGGTRVLIELAAAGEGTVLSISDNGPGLPAGFDPGSSKGLGLKIVQAYAAQLGAEVRFGQAPSGSGSLVTLHLPAGLTQPL